MLITCFNRVQTTLQCLEHLYSCSSSARFLFDIYLVDDRSPDRTGELVKEKYPQVRVLLGTGKLFWCGGMRLAWESAEKENKYDAFLWLNDDTFLYSDWAQNLIKAVDATDGCSLIVGAVCDPVTKCATYGFTGVPPRSPDGTLSPIRPDESINGNFVFVPRPVWLKVGGFRPCFTHGMGDTDYGFRASKMSIQIYLLPNYIGECKANNAPNWRDSKIPLIKRWKLLHSPKGCPPLQYMRVVQTVYPRTWFLNVANLYWRVLFPRK